MGYSPWGRKELDTTKRLHFHFHFITKTSFLEQIWLIAQERDRNKLYSWGQKWFKLGIQKSQPLPPTDLKTANWLGCRQLPLKNQGVLLQGNSQRSLKSGTERSPRVTVDTPSNYPKVKPSSSAHRQIANSFFFFSYCSFLSMNKKPKTTEHLKEDYKIKKRPRWNKWENTQKKRSKETKSDNATVEEHFQKLVLERNLKDIFAIKED